MFSEIPINSDLWYVFRKNKLEYVHLRATSHVSKFARLRSWNIKGLEKKAGHESPAFFFQPTQLTSYFRWDPRKWLPWGWWLPWFPMVDPLRPAPGLAVWPEDNKSNGLTQLPSAKQVELDIQENLVPRRHGRWYCWPRAETRFHGHVNKVK